MVALAVGCEGADTLVEYALRDHDGEGKRETEKRQRRVDTLQQLYDQGKIEEYQFAAGRHFQNDCETAELRVQSSPEMNATGSIVYFGLSDGKLAALESASKARGRLRKAFGLFGGKDTELYAVRVLLGRWSPSAAAASIPKWDAHMGMPVLRLVLNVLDRFYAESTRAS